MKILVINAGSSSLKYQLIDMDNEKMVCKGNCEKIGLEMGIFGHKTADGRSISYEVKMADHTEAFQQVKNALLDKEVGVISDLSEVTAIGHRIVQGGALFSESVLVDESVVEGIESLIPLAPLHNKAHVQGIRACLNVFGKEVPEVVVFDTAFHSTMPRKAYIYPIPYEYYEKYQVRRYGFHGTSHRYVSARCAELMGKDIKDLKIISCHIGNGSSITAIDGGKVIDTTMGLTPLEGIMMGTRSGSIDPAIIAVLCEREGLTAKEVDNILNKKSGMLGLTAEYDENGNEIPGTATSDNRTIEGRSRNGDKRAMLVEDMLCHQLMKYIGGFAAAMGGVDAVVFTGGIGENNPHYRTRVAEKLSFLGTTICEDANKVRGQEIEISTDDSALKLLVIPTDEELLIAQDTYELAK